MEQKDLRFGGSCRLLLSWLVLDGALVMKLKKAGGVCVPCCVLV